MEPLEPAGPEHPRTRDSDPPRPGFSETLPIVPDIPRPWVAHLIAPLVLLSALAFIPYTVDAVMRQRAIRTRLEGDLAERSPDYPASDVEQAALIGVIGLLALSILLVLAEIRCVIQLRRKVRGARTWLLVLTMLHAPLIALSPFVRGGGQYDDLSALIQLGCLLLALFVSYLPSVTAWLSAVKRQGPIPLRPSREP